MKVGVFSDDLASDFSLAARLAAEHGAEGIAVRNVFGKPLKELDSDTVATIKHLAARHGLEVSCVASQFGRGFYIDDAEAQRSAEAELETAIAHAEALGTYKIRIFALWLRGQDALANWSRRPDLDQYLDMLVARLEPSLARAERAGMTLMVELEGASYIGQVAEARRLLEQASSPALALCWDVANGWWSGEPPPDGLRAAKGLPIVDVHTKDVRADPTDPTTASLERAVVGHGDIPYHEILAQLAHEGYTGYVTAERVFHPLKPEENPELQRDALADLSNLRALVSGLT